MEIQNINAMFSLKEMPSLFLVLKDLKNEFFHSCFNYQRNLSK